ncbi:hypothetical protein JD77_02743 [Micromonospora olivasterospora]|uniref:Uncharacterized protein n=1 Tax=Micromonospora olivasterospora TaxID=1880 RepID=A0A562IAD6_MICOL|nr:hypothetical protein JD77_02743 [Micromonospora olivasterospora]
MTGPDASEYRCGLARVGGQAPVRGPAWGVGVGWRTCGWGWLVSPVSTTVTLR